MTSDNLITRIGQALWGPRWQTEMARALDVSKDSVQDWRQGRARPRPGVYADLLVIAQRRRDEIAKAIAQLRP